MPTLAQVINKINSDIIANGNEEITGLVLNSVLLDMVSQINDLVGELGDLNTDDITSIVNAINSLKDELDNYIDPQMGVLTGFANPNETEPIGFNGRVGIIYLKMITIGFESTPESYWIYTGINDIGWLNLTANDVFKMVVVDHYEDLPAQGQTNRIYFVQDENNTYIWNVNIFPNDYILVGSVIEGEHIDDTTFNDEFGNPVSPNTGNLYLDTVTGKYYRWDGTYFLPIDQETGGGGGIQSIQEGDNISIDNTDPQNPVISALGGEQQFVKITEGSNTGWGLKYRADNPDNYGDIGNFAIDLSYNPDPSSTVGATGIASTVSGGLGNTASGQISTVSGGFDNTASGASTVSGGESNTASGNYSTVSGGLFNTANSFGEWVGGINGTIPTGQNATTFVATDRLFNIGNGTATNARSNAFTILKNGLATLPSVNNTLIDAEPTGKAVVTKEWVQDFYTTIPGYDAGETQTLKHVNGVLQWVTD